MMLAEVDELKKIYAAEKVVAQARAEANDLELRQRQQIRWQWELQCTAPKWLALTFVVGLFIGGAIALNAVPVALGCKSSFCEWVRFDGRTVEM